MDPLASCLTRCELIHFSEKIVTSTLILRVAYSDELTCESILTITGHRKSTEELLHVVMCTMHKTVCQTQRFSIQQGRVGLQNFIEFLHYQCHILLSLLLSETSVITVVNSISKPRLIICI